MAALPLHVFGLKPCMLGNPGEHPRPDLFIIMEGKDVVGPSGAREKAMGAILPFDTPAYGQQCRQNSSCSRAGPGSHVAAKEILTRIGPTSAWQEPEGLPHAGPAWLMPGAYAV